MAVQYLRVNVVAEKIDCSQNHVRHLVRTGKLTATRIGIRGIRIKSDSVDDFLKKRAVESTEVEKPKPETKSKSKPKPKKRTAKKNGSKRTKKK